ncbi:MAG: DNA polymerase III subunit [PVC group bacterium]|nr:DNA polymerase III subunit [PVC group bacterium]
MRVDVENYESISDKTANFLQSVAQSKGCSLLFVGENKQRISQAVTELAKYVNCLDSSIAVCDDQCSSCIKIAKKQHPDVVWIEPKGTSSKIKIEDIRRLKELSNLKPYEARKKVFIIRDAERLTPESANAMLKVLEEPPQDAILILIAESANQLLPTVVSRCQLIRFSGVEFSVTEEPEAIQELAEGFFESTELAQCSKLINETAALSRGECERLLQEVAFILRDMLMASLNVSDYALMSRQPEANIKEWTVLFSRESMEFLVGETLRIKRYVHGNANIKLSIDILIKEIQARKYLD